MLHVALMIITLTTSGEARLSVTEAVSFEAYQQIRSTVVGVLEQRNTQVVEARCGENKLALTPYVHGAKAKDFQHYYQVYLFNDQGFTLTPLPKGKNCDSSIQPRVGRTEWCVLASQAALN